MKETCSPTGQITAFAPLCRYALQQMMLFSGPERPGSAEMGLSYSKGSRMIKNAEKKLGFRLLERWTGGSGGGGSRVTPEGLDLLDKYRELVRRVREETEIIFADIFNDDRTGERSPGENEL